LLSFAGRPSRRRFLRMAWMPRERKTVVRFGKSDGNGVEIRFGKAGWLPVRFCYGPSRQLVSRETSFRGNKNA
jgi:hypothetical protein